MEGSHDRPTALTWTVLGAGTASPHPDRSPSGHLLQSPTTTLLIDLGPGTLWRLARAGVDWTALDGVVLSHAHLDHVLDLPALMFAANLPGHGRERPLPIFASRPCLELIERLGVALGKWFVPRGFEALWTPIEAGRLELGDIVFHADEVLHHPSSLGFRFEGMGRSVAYSGDSDVCDGLVRLCGGADLAVLECSTSDADKAPGHLSPAGVAEIALEARAAAVALVHMYPSLDGVDLPAAVRHHGYEGDVTRCPDGLRFVL